MASPSPKQITGNPNPLLEANQQVQKNATADRNKRKGGFGKASWWVGGFLFAIFVFIFGGKIVQDVHNALNQPTEPPVVRGSPSPGLRTPPTAFTPVEIERRCKNVTGVEVTSTLSREFTRSSSGPLFCWYGSMGDDAVLEIVDNLRRTIQCSNQAGTCNILAGATSIRLRMLKGGPGYMYVGTH